MVARFNAWAATKLVGLKTRLWNSFLAVAGGSLTVLQMFDVIDLRNYLEPKIAGYAMLAIGVIGYWLRHVTALEQKK